MKKVIFFCIFIITFFALSPFTDTGLALHIIRGKVISINRDHGTLRLRDTEGLEHSMRVEPKSLLNEIEVGDEVKVKLERGIVNFIKKVGDG